MDQMIKLSLLQTRRSKRTDESSKNSWKSRLSEKSGTSENTASSSIKRKGEAAKLTQAKQMAAKKAVENISVTGSNMAKLEEIELTTGTKENLSNENNINESIIDTWIDQLRLILKPNLVNGAPYKTWEQTHQRNYIHPIVLLQTGK